MTTPKPALAAMSSKVAKSPARRGTYARRRASPRDGRLTVDRGLFARARPKPSHLRSSTTAPMAAAFRSAPGLCSISARRPAPSIERARQSLWVPLAKLQLSDAGRVIEAKRPHSPKGRSSKRKSATAHAPAAKRTCAAALTFGLPGKQKVKSGWTGRNLIRPVRHLHQILKDFTDRRRACSVPHPFIYGCGAAASTIWSFRNWRSLCPAALRALG